MSRITAAVAAAAAGVVLAGCGGGHSGDAAAPSEVTSGVAAPAEPPGGYDIGRIAALSGDFPPGFTVTDVPRTTLTQEQADSANSFGDALPMTFDPPYCNTMLKAPHVVAGGQSQGLFAEGPQQITVLAARSAEPSPDTVLGGGCDHVAIKIADMGQGTVERLPGPDIDGVLTAGVHAHMDMTLSGQSRSMDRTAFFAGLSDQTAIIVMGESDPQLLSDLLVKGVAALRDG